MPSSVIRGLRKEARARRAAEEQLAAEQAELDARRARLVAQLVEGPPRLPQQPQPPPQQLAQQAQAQPQQAQPPQQQLAQPLPQQPLPQQPQPQHEHEHAQPRPARGSEMGSQDDAPPSSGTSTKPSPPVPSNQVGPDEVRMKWKTTQVVVQAGSVKQVPLEVATGNYVEWGFKTEGGDIGFAVLLEKADGDLVTVVDDAKVPSHEESIQGSVVVEEPGRLWLQWDNAYSWLTNKDLTYSISLLPSKPPSAGGDDSGSAGASEPDPPQVYSVGTAPPAPQTQTQTQTQAQQQQQQEQEQQQEQQQQQQHQQQQQQLSQLQQQPQQHPEPQKQQPLKYVSGKLPRVILGTMTMGGQANTDASEDMLESFVSAKCVRAHLTAGRMEIDAARMYQHGGTERVLGELLRKRPDIRQHLFLATKANPFPGYNESLRPESVTAQLEQSLKDLGVSSVDLFYLHAPDHSTAIEATLEACQRLHERGLFRELGLSNYSAWQTVQIYYICKERGWVRPSVYQGMYNAVTRQVEQELLPALRALGIRFYAYNPLAGGLLTGKHHSVTATPTEGRFGESEWGVKYRNRYWHASFFAGLELVSTACQKAGGIPLADASVRWLMHHSQLRGGQGDGVILGASTLAHLDQNLAAAEAAPLPLEVVQAFNSAWKVFQAQCPSYSR